MYTEQIAGLLVVAAGLGTLVGYLLARGRALRAEARAELLESTVARAPLEQSLDRMDRKLDEFARQREGAFEALHTELRTLREGARELQRETGNLARAMRAPTTRGRWGELQLRRVVELAGMVSHCDFAEQVHVEGAEGALRPDMVVHLPGGRHVVVDAKVPLDAYLRAIEEEDAERRREKFVEHARAVRTHIQGLGRKAYWDQFAETPEFVVLFLPGEAIFSTALEHEPSLIEYGVDRQIIIATPTTLIALLRAVAYGWRNVAIEKHAREISQLGADLYRRLADMASHFDKLGRSLDRAVGAYNRSVATFESRVLVSARRFKSLEAAPAASAKIDQPKTVDTAARRFSAPEMRFDEDET